MDSRMKMIVAGGESRFIDQVFSDNMESQSQRNKLAKVTLQLRKPEAPKVMLQYRGRKANNNYCNDSGVASARSASCRTTSPDNELSDNFDKMSLSSNDSIGDRYPMPAAFCQVCFLVECQRRSHQGKAGPAVTDFGPWLSHSAWDGVSRNSCPLLYFNSCMCGANGGKTHALSECGNIGYPTHANHNHH